MISHDGKLPITMIVQELFAVLRQTINVRLGQKNAASRGLFLFIKLDVSSTEPALYGFALRT